MDVGEGGGANGGGAPQHSFGAKIADQKIQVRAQTVHQTVVT